jgi:diguanylate cyclase
MDNLPLGRRDTDALQSELQALKRERDALAERVRELEEQWTPPSRPDAEPEAEWFEGAFRIEQSRAKRQRLALSLAMIELDDVQDLRDRLGHAAGEVVFAHLGAQLAASLRPTDVVCRIDGLSYGVLLTATNLEQALAAVTRLQREISKHPFVTAHAQTRLSFSAGIVQWRNDEVLGDLLTRASRALGLAKKAGTGKAVVG